MLLRRKAQSTLEYAILVALIAAAIVAIQVQLRQRVEGRLKQSGEEIGDRYATGDTYSDYYTTFDSTSREQTRAAANEDYAGQGALNMSKTTTTSTTNQTRIGIDHIAPDENVTWW